MPLLISMYIRDPCPWLHALLLNLRSQVTMDVEQLMELESKALEWIGSTGCLEKLDRARELAGDKLLPEPFLLEASRS
jgi:hypothetical protein